MIQFLAVAHRGCRDPGSVAQLVQQDHGCMGTVRVSIRVCPVCCLKGLTR